MCALAYDPEPFDDHAMHERPVRELCLVDESSRVLRGEAGSDAPRPADGRTLHESDLSQLRGGEGASSREVPEGTQHGEPAPSVAAFSDALALYVNACMRLQDAMRAGISTGPSEIVMLDRYKNLMRLARELAA